jgi:DNA-binding transcriptional regulator YdaS (Cro superfamily)
MSETLKKYLKGKSRESFAHSIGTTKNYVNLLVVHLRRPSPDLALRIEQATGGQVTRDMMLYPELYATSTTQKSNNLTE